ncbi:MAG: hypothetical protein R2710_27675 [Acidimicrobiales bacterium]
MRKKALSLSVFTATAMAATPAFAQVDPTTSTTDAPEGAVTDVGTGDAEVTLVTTTTGAVLPGQDAWVNFMWVGDSSLQARNFAVTAVGSEGVEIGYPEDHEENVRDFSSLYDSSVLDPTAYDFTALKLVVSPDAVDPHINLTVSYDSDSGPVTQTFVSTVLIDTSVYEGEALELAGGLLGSVTQGEAAWFPLEISALHNASGIEVRVADAGDFDIRYPNEVDYSSLSKGSRIIVGNQDFAAIRFDAAGVEPGIHTVELEVTYFVGLTQITQTIERTIEVTDSGSGAGDGSTDDGSADDGTTDDGTNGDGTTDGVSTDGGTTGDGTTDGGTTGDGSTGEGNTDGGSTDGGSGQSDGPVTLGSLAQGVDGWIVNPYGTDTAVTGVWGYGQPPVGIWNKLLLEMGSTRAATRAGSPCRAPAPRWATTTSTRARLGAVAGVLAPGGCRRSARLRLLPVVPHQCHVRRLPDRRDDHRGRQQGDLERAGQGQHEQGSQVDLAVGRAVELRRPGRAVPDHRR